LYEWITLDYDWPSAAEREAYIASGRFIVENNALAGVKGYDGEIYVTVPRWRPGVPSTLNKVVHNGTAYVLQPYPSWAMQEVGNYSALQYVQSMEIDSRGWMWILDAGRLNLLADSSLIVNGPPKLIIWDINANCPVREFVFPNDVLPYNNSWANDIVVDQANGFAYITDTKPTGGVVIYDFVTNQARRFDDESMHGTKGSKVTINGTTFTIAPMGTDGIALSHDRETLYFCDLSGVNVYSVPTFYLRNFALTSSEIATYLTNIGVKGFSDGMAFTDQNQLVFASQAQSALYVWDVTTPLEEAQFIVGDNDTMEWIDTFGFTSEDGSLLFTSNKLLKWINNSMKFDGSDGANFRVWSVSLPNGADSYLTGVEPDPKHLTCLVKD